MSQEADEYRGLGVSPSGANTNPEGEMLKARSLLNRHLYQQKIADAAEAQLELLSPTAYINFDAERGLARLQNTNGSIFYGLAQTNGAVGKGDSIRLRRGGVTFNYDSMPRILHPADTTKVKQKLSCRLRILFFVFEDGVTNFYIGGDRVAPKLIYSYLGNGISSDLSGAISNNGNLNDYIAAIKIGSGLKLNIDAQGAETIPTNFTPHLIHLGYGAWQSVSLIEYDFFTDATTPTGSHYDPVKTIQNYSVDNKEFHQSISTFTESFVALYNGFIPSIPVVTQIFGTDGRSNNYQYNFVYTPASFINPVDTKYHLKIKIDGDFLVCQWQDAYIIEKVINWEGSLDYETFNPGDRNFSFAGSKSYLLHSSKGVKSLNSDDIIIVKIGALVFNDEKTEATITSAGRSSAADYYYTQHFLSYFSSNFIGHPVLFTRKVGQKYEVTRGNITNFSSDSQSKIIVKVSIQETKTVKSCSVSNKLISDNGSWLAYFFASASEFPMYDTSYWGYEFFTKERLFCSYLGNSLFSENRGGSEGDFSLRKYYAFPLQTLNKITNKTDNLIDKVIYRTIYSSSQSYPKTKFMQIFVEEWDITDDGLIRYSGRVK